MARLAGVGDRSGQPGPRRFSATTRPKILPSRFSKAAAVALRGTTDVIRARLAKRWKGEFLLALAGTSTTLKAMRRTRWSRALSAVMAVWLVVSLSEPAFLHSCPVHSLGSGAHRANVVLQAFATHHHDWTDSTAPVNGHETHNCTCIGSCCCATPIGLAAPRVLAAVSEPTAFRDTGLPEYAYLPVAADHVLPFQNGPPAVV